MSTVYIHAFIEPLPDVAIIRQNDYRLTSFRSPMVSTLIANPERLCGFFGHTNGKYLSRI